MPYSLQIVCGFFYVPQGLWFIVFIQEDLRVYKHLLVLLQRCQHFLLSYFKTLRVGLARVKHVVCWMAAGCSTNWATAAID